MSKYGAQRGTKLGEDGDKTSLVSEMDIDQDTCPSSMPRKARKAVVGRKKASQAIAAPTGYFDWLPTEVTQVILDRCTAQQLAALETTCRYFRDSMIVEQTALAKLKAIPRSKGLVPNRK